VNGEVEHEAYTKWEARTKGVGTANSSGSVAHW